MSNLQDVLISIRAEEDPAIGGQSAVFKGKKIIKAFVYSASMSLHLEPVNGLESWAITHIPTGLRMMDVKGPMQIAEGIIAQLLHVDWNFGSFGSQELLDTMPEETREVFMSAWAASRVEYAVWKKENEKEVKKVARVKKAGAGKR
jgi:hypothetical protein